MVLSSEETELLLEICHNKYIDLQNIMLDISRNLREEKDETFKKFLLNQLAEIANDRDLTVDILKKLRNGENN